MCIINDTGEATDRKAFLYSLHKRTIPPSSRCLSLSILQCLLSLHKDASDANLVSYTKDYPIVEDQLLSNFNGKDEREKKL